MPSIDMLIRTTLRRLLTSMIRYSYYTIILCIESKGTFLLPIGLMIRVVGNSKVQIASFCSDSKVQGHCSYLCYIILYDGI